MSSAAQNTLLTTQSAMHLTRQSWLGLRKGERGSLTETPYVKKAAP